MSESEKLAIVIHAMSLLAKNDEEGYNLTDEEEAVCNQALDILELDHWPYL